MPTLKKIEKIFSPPTPHWVGNGFHVHNFFPGNGALPQERMSPFLMLDYNPYTLLPPSEQSRGVGVHPHRGFETVTIAYHGSIAHHDSAGNSDVIHPGDVQWMTAAAGILHKEYHEESFCKRGGAFQMVQLWVNLPRHLKMSPPTYQALTSSMMGKGKLPHDAGTLDIIAGELYGIKGPAHTHTPMLVANIELDAGKKTDLVLSEHWNTALLVLQGHVQVNEQDVAANHFVLFANQGDSISIQNIEKTSTEATKILLLSGEPINEPIAWYGPFVMNTQQELQTTFKDYQRGAFGVLED
jgi:redox-sensitive bicupin YhaK (pirin superfamily)